MGHKGRRRIGTDTLTKGAGDRADGYDQGFNDADIPSPSIPPPASPTHPLGVCPVGTPGRWLEGTGTLK